MTNKKRNQINWKFKVGQSEEFYEWFNNQDNIGQSLQMIVNTMIELYGTQDIQDYHVQKQIYNDIFVLQALRGKNVLGVNQDMINQTVNQNEVKLKEIDTKTDNETVIHTEEPIVIDKGMDQEEKENQINYNAINMDNI
ncbi:hypothetical protein [Metabacillus fastidiosus]|uniref:hypothetical protein n=1 Tax=Metabacillus fastidiosus TaxID=1458 RepID=UPI003D2A789D